MATDTTRGTHTPGPWGYVHHKGLDQHLVGPTGENVAIIEDRHGNAEANARLIASAPTLLAAAKSMHDEFGLNHDEVCDSDCHMCSALDETAAAIDAATGGQS